MKPVTMTMLGVTWAILAAAAMPAQADILRYEFSGVVTSVTGAPPAPWNTVAPGTPMTIEYWFDTEAPDLEPFPLLGTYGPMPLMVVRAGAAVMEFEDFFIDVYNDLGFDAYNPQASSLGMYAEVHLLDPTETAFESDALPALTGLEPFFLRQFALEDIGNWEIRGDVTGFVPAPGAASLLGLGALVLVPRRRRSSCAGQRRA